MRPRVAMPGARFARGRFIHVRRCFARHRVAWRAMHEKWIVTGGIDAGRTGNGEVIV